MTCTSPGAPRFALCRPDHFSVSYRINAWMDPARWAEDPAGLRGQASSRWRQLADELESAGAVIEVSRAATGVPDQVFMANSAVVLDGRVLLGRFRHPERRPEEPVHRRFFEDLAARGLVSEILPMAQGLAFEGAGDCVWDAVRQLFWMGHGPRSDVGAAAVVADCFGVDVVPVALVGDRYYHLDTCFAALPGGEVLAFRPAFTEASWRRIADRVGPESLIEADEEDAGLFALNAIALGTTVITAGMTAGLRRRLQERGYRCRLVPLAPFLLAGGGAYCLALRLDLGRDSAAAA